MSAATKQFKIIVNGEDVTPSDGMYSNQGIVKVPFTHYQDKDTYMPIRMISELLGISINYDAKTQTIEIDSENQVGSPTENNEGDMIVKETEHIIFYFTPKAFNGYSSFVTKGESILGFTRTILVRTYWMKK